LKFLEENIGNTLEDIDTSNYFLNRILIAQEINARIDIMYYIKLKMLSIEKDSNNRVKGQTVE
jgi:hypothetical protein